MDWALVLLVLMPGSEPQQIKAGYLSSEALCMSAAVGIAQTIVEAEPSAVVGWKCTKGDKA